MKIHIVQKGDTLWEIAKNYGVDFEQLKQINSQLSSPDMIMPGMKIKIPSSSKPVKKETKKEIKKEMKKETIKEKPKAEHPYKNLSPKPIEVIKEDDVKETKKITVEKPIFQVPTMPILDSSLPEIPKEKPIKEQKKKEVQKPKVPPKEKQVSPEMPSPEEKLPEYVPPQMMPMMPVCHYVHPCCYHMYHPFAPVAGNMYGGMMHHCQPHMHHPHMVQQPAVGGMVQNEMPTMHLPQEDCGCGSSNDYHHQHMGYQAPGFAVPNNHYEHGEAQPSTLPFQMNPSHQPYNPYPTPPVAGGPPSFADLGMRLNEEDNKSEE